MKNKATIGFFDSGFGGLTIMKEVTKLLPEYDYVYLGDNARTPYGSRSEEIIYQYTCEGVNALFSSGAQLVILACNTASAVALRRLQQEWLVENYPDKKVLGIFVPTIEHANFFKSKTIGLFATQATIQSGAFTKEIEKLHEDFNVIGQVCPLLVPAIEAGDFIETEKLVKKYVEEIFEKDATIGTIILGCTHYAIVENLFRKYIPEDTEIISQGVLIAKSLKEYLARHHEIAVALGKNGQRKFMTTENSSRIEHLAELFYGEKINLKSIKL